MFDLELIRNIIDDINIIREASTNASVDSAVKAEIQPIPHSSISNMLNKFFIIIIKLRSIL